MTPKQAPSPDDALRMKSEDFDRIMRGALGVAAPPVETKPKPKPKATPKKRATASAAKKPIER